MGAPLFLAPPLLAEIGRGAVGIAVDAVIAQRVRRIDDALDRVAAIALLAFRRVVAREGEIVEDALGIGPLPEEVVVLEEMVVAEGGMRDDERLHGHGILFHDVADAGLELMTIS